MLTPLLFIVGVVGLAFCVWLALRDRTVTLAAYRRAGPPRVVEEAPGIILGILIALPLSTWAARADLERQERALRAVFFEASLNQRVLREAVEGDSWTMESVGTAFPVNTVVESVTGGADFFSSDADLGIVQGALAYSNSMEATRRTMEFLHDRFTANGGELTEENLRTLDGACRRAVAVTYALQDRLGQVLGQRELALGVQEEFEGFRRALEDQQARVEREVRRKNRGRAEEK